MSDLHEAAMSALAHDIRAEQMQAAERRDFNDALLIYSAGFKLALEQAITQDIERMREAVLSRAAEQLNGETK